MLFVMMSWLLSKGLGRARGVRAAAATTEARAAAVRGGRREVGLATASPASQLRRSSPEGLLLGTPPPLRAAAPWPLRSVRSLSTLSSDDVSTSGAGTAFEALGLSETLLEALDELGLDEPSEIQRLAIEGILHKAGKLDALGQNGILLASQTGSGKTLAYLLPIVHQLKRFEEVEGRARPKRPRCIVVAPTQELVEQIFKVAKSLGHVVKFSSTMVSARSKIGQQKRAMERPMDILVGTPNRILRLNREGYVWFGDARFLVLDEADLLLDDDYLRETTDLVDPVLTKEDKAKVVMVTASKTKPVERFLHSHLNGGIEVETTSLHKAVSSARHHFVNQVSRTHHHHHHHSQIHTSRERKDAKETDAPSSLHAHSHSLSLSF